MKFCTVRRWITLAAGSLIACAGLAACGPTEELGPLVVTVEVDTLPTGLVQVEHRLESRGEPRWRAVEEWRVGGGEGDPVDWTQARFGFRDFAVDTLGNRIYLLDASGRGEIRVLTLAGKVERVIDASEARIDGEGVLRGLVLGPHGDLFVRDNDGYSVLDPDGHLMSRHHFGTSFTETPQRAGNEWLLEWAFEIEGSEHPDDRTWRYTPTRIPWDLSHREDLPPLEVTVRYLPGAPIPPPLSNRLLDHGTDDGIWFADSKEYRLYHRTFEGDTMRIVTFQGLPPARVSPAERERLAGDWDSVYPPDPDDIPEVEPALGRLAGDDHGRLLAFPQLEDAPGGTAADVFRDGIFEGRIAMPVTLSLRHHKPVLVQGHLYGVMLDEDEVPHFVRLRVEGWGEGDR